MVNKIKEGQYYSEVLYITYTLYFLAALSN